MRQQPFEFQVAAQLVIKNSLSECVMPMQNSSGELLDFSSKNEDTSPCV